MKELLLTVCFFLAPKEFRICDWALHSVRNIARAKEKVLPLPVLLYTCDIVARRGKMTWGWACAREENGRLRACAQCHGDAKTEVGHGAAGLLGTAHTVSAFLQADLSQADANTCLRPTESST